MEFTIRAGLAAVSQYGTEHGPFTPDEIAEADEWAARQAQLARLLAGCEVENLDDARARAAGALAGRAQTADAAGAAVVEGALRRADLIITSDDGDLAAIAAAGRRAGISHPSHPVA